MEKIIKKLILLAVLFSQSALAADCLTVDRVAGRLTSSGEIAVIFSWLATVSNSCGHEQGAAIYADALDPAGFSLGFDIDTGKVPAYGSSDFRGIISVSPEHKDQVSSFTAKANARQ